MSKEQYTTTTGSTNYSKFRRSLNTTGQPSPYYQIGYDAFARDLDENPDDDSAFTMAVLLESEHVKDLKNCKTHWRNGWMDAYQNKYLRSSTTY